MAAGQVTLLPKGFNTRAYEAVLGYKVVWRAYGNTILYTVVGTSVNLIITMLGAYPLSRPDFYGKNVFTFFIAVTMIFSGGMIPEYLVMRRLGLLNSMWILVIKHGINVSNIVLMRNFFEGIPGSLFEAAKIDGCSPMRIFLRIVLPLSKAALASIGLMFAVGVWNDYSTVQIYITDPNQVNFQYKLRVMIMDGDTPPTQYPVSQTTLYNAGIIAAILPFLILYPFLQKYFVKGVNIGAVKE